MLAPDERAVLREHLRPDPGAKLEVAVATTFTLDLVAALVAPLSFASFDIGSGQDPVAVLEAVRGAADRVTIFCQAGQIRVPTTSSDLMALLEPMVHEVVPPHAGFVFHPKVWVLRYGTSDGPTFRLLCGSRNLTGDVSWDTIVRIDGVIGGARPRTGNRPLVDLVESLPRLVVRRLPAVRLAQVMELADDLRRVDWELPGEVTEVAYHLLGLQRRRGAPILDAMEGRRVLVVSPFLDDEGLRTVTEDRDAVVVSRPEALEQLRPDIVEGLSCRIINPLAALADPDDAADDGTTTLLGGLHSKLYVVERARQAHVFIGSANATSAGLHEGNVEFLVEVIGGIKRFGVDALLGPDAGLASILDVYEPTGGQPAPVEETIGRELENLLRRLAGLKFDATVIRDGGITLRVETNDAITLGDGVEVTVGLLTRPGLAVPAAHGSQIDAEFGNMQVADVTPFVVLRAAKAEGGNRVERATVVRAHLHKDLPERLDEIIARQVDTPEKFLRFVALLLGLGELPFGVPGHEDRSGSGSTWIVGGGPGLFELVARAIGDRPEALHDLDRLVMRLEQTEQGRSVLPPNFEAFWTTVRVAIDRLAGAKP